MTRLLVLPHDAETINSSKTSRLALCGTAGRSGTPEAGKRRESRLSVDSGRSSWPLGEARINSRPTPPSTASFLLFGGVGVGGALNALPP
jgi:hypothetical protein